MCLRREMLGRDRVKYERRTTGWKVFRNTPLGLISQYQGNRKIVPTQTWIRENTYRGGKVSGISFGLTSSRTYKNGFHVYLERPERHEPGFVIRKVWFREVTTLGHTYKFTHSPVAVAEEVWVSNKNSKSQKKLDREYRVRRRKEVISQ